MIKLCGKQHAESEGLDSRYKGLEHEVFWSQKSIFPHFCAQTYTGKSYISVSIDKCKYLFLFICLLLCWENNYFIHPICLNSLISSVAGSAIQNLCSQLKDILWQGWEGQQFGSTSLLMYLISSTPQSPSYSIKHLPVWSHSQYEETITALTDHQLKILSIRNSKGCRAFSKENPLFSFERTLACLFN